MKLMSKHSSTPAPMRGTQSRLGTPKAPRWLGIGALLGALSLTACGGGSSSSEGPGAGTAPGPGDTPGTGPSAEPAVGAVNFKPGAEGFYNADAYIVDDHGGGDDSAVFIEDVYSGRLVDIYDRDDSDASITRLVYPDFVVGSNVITSPGKWTLETNPVTGVVSLIIDAKGSPGDSQDFDGSTRFDDLVREAQLNLSSVLPKSTAVGTAPPFSVMPRNGVLVVQFSDLIDASTVSLQNSVKVLTGTPIALPQEVRLFMSPNFGGIDKDSNTFHSTRLVIDMTVSSEEQQSVQNEFGVSLQLNGLGLPPSQDVDQANFGLRFPTQAAPQFGQFGVLRNLSGSTLAQAGNGPTINGQTFDVVRAMRTGASFDVNNGFLLDLERPSILGVQGISVLSAAINSDPGVDADFIVSLRFNNPICSTNPVSGDVIDTGAVSLEATSAASVSAGIVSGLPVKLTGGASLDDAELAALQPELLGSGSFRTVWRETLSSTLAPCFVRFSPTPGVAPSSKVPSNAKIVVRFSEPMDPGSFSAFDSFSVRDVELVSSNSPFRELVLGRVTQSGDLLDFSYEPTLPLAHAGSDRTYYFTTVSEPGEGLRDLAGNALEFDLPEIPFTVLGEGQDPVQTDGWVLTFDTLDADGNEGGGLDIVGSYLYQSESASRPVSRFAQVADRSNPIIGPMQAITTGLQTPLSDLGSKMHIMYRYADVGLGISDTDPSFVNVDVEGMALSPEGGSVTPTFYPEFEMRMGHSRAMPDEELSPTSNLPIYPDSGIRQQWTYEQNFLEDPNAVVKTVHKRQDGFQVSNLGLFNAPGSGTPMLSMPMNQNLPISEQVTFTWRDTSILGRGGFTATGLSAQNGVPYEREIALFGLNACQGEVYGGDAAGVAHAGVRSIGLPLLMEFSCFPSNAISLNNFDVSIAINSSNQPFFRAFSTGGFNASGNAITKDPDNQVSPTGGFNGNPALPGGIGAATPPRDPTIYIGQLDLVIRISRVYTVMLDSLQTTPDYAALVQEPDPADQPDGTQIQYAYRGHLAELAGGPVLDPRFRVGESMSVYGDISYQPLLNIDDMCNPNDGIDVFDPTLPVWTEELDDIDGLRFSQLRMTFVGNLETELTPALSAVGLAYRF